jgi:2',3'-cyclic-nucleotide 2'-phosphodiesterase (5'-nucleotidase family)
MKAAIILSIVLIGAGITACSSYLTPRLTSNQNQGVDRSIQPNSQIDSLVGPYKRELDKEMSRVIGQAVVALQVARPSSNLGSWVSDASLNYFRSIDSLKAAPVICIMNTGGIRSAIAKGPITVGDIFKVMPFDNRLVAMKLPIKAKSDISAYLKTTGGEPIAGFTIQKGDIVFDKEFDSFDYIWVVTTDFLANGGDKMSFFQQATTRIETNVLLRDVLMEAVRTQQEIGKENYSARINW